MALMRQYGTTVDENVIDRVLRFNKADIADSYLTTIRATAIAYVQGIFRKLREHEYNPELMRLHVVGGGSCMIKNFGHYDANRVSINRDICATAKGYELLATRKLHKKGCVLV